ncbi:hypothetical protein PRNP1_001990 [Phytophthora ramorum]
MQPRVSSTTVALAVAVMAVGMSEVTDARPMHAAIVSKYHRYLAEKEAVSTELDAWLKTYGPKGPKNGWIPVTESRSIDDDLEDQRQRFYLTKEQIYEAREANPMAEFGTDGPFTLMTMDEFKSFLSNSHVGGDDEKEKDTPSPQTDTPSPTTQSLSENENGTPATKESNVVSNSDSNSKNKNDDKEKKTWAPATEGPQVIAAVRRLRTSGKSQYAFNGGDYSTDSDESFQSTSDTYTQTSQQTYQSESTNNGDNEGNTNGEYNFNNVSPGDSSQVGTVSGGSNGGTTTQSWNWWGSNGWSTKSNTWWSGNNWSWNTGGSAAGSSNSQQWTQPPSSGSSNTQWNSQQWTQPPSSGSSNTQWNSQQWTQPPSSDNANEEPTTPATQPPTEAPTTEAPAPAITEAPAPVVTEAPVTAPPSTPAPVPATKAPPTAAPATAAPAPATAAPAPAAPATKKKSTTTVKDTKTAGDSDSNSVDWSTSACVNPPGLQGQCGSCWAFATVAALEAAQCIANGDKKAPSYSEQQLVSCDTKDFGCNGGAPVYAMEYVRDNGVCTKSSYPYSSVDGGTAAACSTSCTPTKSGISEIVQLPTGDESALLSAVKQQPVIVSVASDNSAWKQYVSGVITACDTTTVDHAVLAVGYDATTIKIKNSWGTDWGEDGYVRISRSTQNKGTCSVLTDMSYPKL